MRRCLDEVAKVLPMAAVLPCSRWKSVQHMGKLQANYYSCLRSYAMAIVAQQSTVKAWKLNIFRVRCSVVVLAFITAMGLLAGSSYASVKAGTVRWKLAIGKSGGKCSAVAKDGSVYTVTGESLVAVNATGKEVWRVTVGMSVCAVPTIGKDGTIYVGLARIVDPDSGISKGVGDAICAVDPKGKRKWTFKPSDPARTVQQRMSPVAIGSDGTLYAGSWGRQRLYAINPEGKQIWSLDLNRQVGTPAVGPDGTIYVGTMFNGFFAVDPKGKKKWHLRLNGIMGVPVVGADGTVYFGDSVGALHAVSPKGKEKWTYRTSTAGDIQTAPVLGVDGTIYFGCDDGNLYAVDKTGKLRWKSKIGGKVRSSPAVGADGTIFCGATSGKLFAIGPKGDNRWPLALDGGECGTPTIGPDGTLYIYTKKGVLYAVKTESSADILAYSVVRAGIDKLKMPTGTIYTVYIFLKSDSNDAFIKAMTGRKVFVRKAAGLDALNGNIIPFTNSVKIQLMGIGGAGSHARQALLQSEFRIEGEKTWKKVADYIKAR